MARTKRRWHTTAHLLGVLGSTLLAGALALAALFGAPRPATANSDIGPPALSCVTDPDGGTSAAWIPCASNTDCPDEALCGPDRFCTCDGCRFGTECDDAGCRCARQTFSDLPTGCWVVESTGGGPPSGERYIACWSGDDCPSTTSCVAAPPCEPFCPDRCVDDGQPPACIDGQCSCLDERAVDAGMPDMRPPRGVGSGCSVSPTPDGAGRGVLSVLAVVVIGLFRSRRGGRTRAW